MKKNEEYENMPAKQEQFGNFVLTIERLASNPDVDVNKIKQIIDMQEHINDKNAQQAFNAAMVRAQAVMPVVPLDKENIQTKSRYSSYKLILKMTKPIYTKEGFSVSMYEGVTAKENNIRVCADVMHNEGHTKHYWVDIPLDDRGIKGTVNKTPTHAKGSSFSYGRSYLMKLIFNIPIGDDDDGNAACPPIETKITEQQLADINTMKNDFIKTKKIKNEDDFKSRLMRLFKTDVLEDLTEQQASKLIKKMDLIK